MNESEKSRNQLLSENLELKRIEKFLRAEVAELWSHIKRIESLPFYKLWIKIASRFKFEKPTKAQFTENYQEISNSSFDSKLLNCEYLFVYSTDSHEIGGLKTSVKLAKDLIEEKSWKINGLALNHNPTTLNKDNFFVYGVEERSKIKNVVACGSDTIETAIQMAQDFNANFILLMMGLDHLFAPTYRESQNFIHAIKSADLVICLSPHLAKQALIYGAKRVEVAPLGLDEREFTYSGTPKKRKILVTCRASADKGLKYALPALSLLRGKGWEVVGFGDLSDHEAANAFDRFLGRISATELNIEFQDTKYLIDPSWIEGLGLVALEAAACGVMPIISSRGDYEDLFEPTKRPFIEILNFIDPTKLIEAVEKEENLPDPAEIASRVKPVSWMIGLKISADILETMLKNDSVS